MSSQASTMTKRASCGFEKNNRGKFIHKNISQIRVEGASQALSGASIRVLIRLCALPAILSP